MRTVFTKIAGVLALVLFGSAGAFAQMSGTYTIDASGSGSTNYTSFAAAISALGSSGVNGAVTFEVASGTYTGQVSITSAISGASASNTIKFKGKSGNRGDVVLSNTGTYTVYMVSADYITFEDMTVESSGSYGIYLTSSANYNTFDNVRVNATGSRTYAVYNRQCEFNTFNDCYIDGGYMGFYFYGGGTSSLQEGNVVKNTEMYNQSYYGFYCFYNEGFVMNGVTLDSFSGFSPFYFWYNASNTFANSKIIAPSMSGYAYYYYDNYYATSSDTSHWYNNMMVLHGSYYGVFAYYTTRNKWYNNSLSFTGDSYGAYMYGLDPACEFYNNNWHADGQYYGIYGYNFAGAPKMDYNNLDWNGQSWGVLGSSFSASLAAHQSTYSSVNQNSVDIDPEFEDDNRDLRTYSSSLNNKGMKTSRSWYATDIDGNKRPATGDTKYDIGCNEYFLSPYDLDVVTVTNPLSVIPNGNNTITGLFKNKGSDTLKNQIVGFQYSVDSGSTWSSTINDTIALLAPGNSYSKNLTSSWNPGRTGDFRIHIRISTQVTSDPDAKDETYVDVCSGLAGTYTVGRPGDDFPTLNDAFAKLKCGLAGNTTFRLAGGNGGTRASYGQLKVVDLNGSANATLTIDGQHRDSVLIDHSGGSTFEGAVHIQNSDYIIIKNMTVRHNPNYVGVLISNGADNNVVENLDVSCSQSSYYMSCNLAMTGSSYSSATDVDNNLVKNCDFKGAYYGANLRSSSNASFNNTIEGCSFNDFYYYGMYLYYQDSLSLIGNEVVKNGNIYQYGYNTYTYYNLRSNFEGNYFEGHSYGGLFMYYENRGTNYRSLVANNIINGKTYYCSYGYVALDIYYYSQNIDVYHNTVISDPCGSTTNIGFGQNAAMRLYYTSGCNIKNNILVSLDASGSGVPFIDYYSFSLGDFDYNTYITNSANVATKATSSVSSVQGMQAAWSGSNSNSNDDAVSFVGNGDYHLTTTKDSRRAPAIAGIAEDIDGDTRCSFAASIGADESNYPQPKTKAFFAVDDTVFINAATTFSNRAKVTDPMIHEWYIDKNFVTDTVVDLEFRFGSTGSYEVMLVSEGCGGIDTFRKNVYVKIPTSAPKVDFLASARVVDANEAVKFTNITSNGPDSFYWTVDSYFVTGLFGIKFKSHTYIDGTDSNSTNPVMEFGYPGTYTVSLYAYNLRGSDSMIKTNLISVRQTADMCGVNDFSSNYIGKLYDEGGPNGSYPTNRQLCTYLIDPCTDKIELTFNVFNLASGSYLRVYDGRDNKGKPLHDYHPDFATGFTGDMGQMSHFTKTLTAYSGEVFIEFTSGTASASGFELLWDANVISPNAPSISLSAPDTVCIGAEFSIVNNTSGQDNDYNWYMDTSSSFGFFSDYIDQNVTHSYDTAGTYIVKLVAENCGGADSTTTTIVAIAPTTPPTPGFSVSNSRPAVGDEVKLTNLSSGGKFPCISGYEWTVSRSDFSWADGSNKNSENPGIILADTGCYDISLTVSNSFGDSTYTMKCAVNAISYCIPSVKIVRNDVGISRVKMGNIDNASSTNEDGYENFVNSASTTIEIGASYDVTVERPASSSIDVNRAVWIDYNQDGDFTSSELVASDAQSSSQSWTGTFTVPSSALKGVTRMRVGINLNNFTQYGCGPNQFGEFEDYAINVTADQQAPVIYFNGAQDTTIEQCASWTDPGAYAIDNVNGALTAAATNTISTSTAGKYTIVYEAKDASGNVGTGTRTVTVTADATEPVLTLSGNSVMDLEVFDTYTEPGFTATDNCDGNITANVVVTGSVNDSTLGISTLTYTITDTEGNQTVVTRTVNVVDTEAPAVTLLGNSIDTVEVYTSYNEAGIDITDNYYTGLTYDVDGSVDLNKLGSYTLTYTATDGSGNVSQQLTRTVYVLDQTAPSITLAYGVDTTILVDVFDAYDYEYADVSDNYTSESALKGTLTHTGTYVTAFGTGAANVLGDYTVDYTVTDESGNITTVTRNIKVVDRVAPTLTFAQNPIVLLRWQAFDATTDGGETASDNYAAPNEVTVTVVSDNVDVNSKGAYQVVYQTEDPSGNTSTHTLYVVVTEDETTLSIDNATMTANIFPNPTSGLLNINVDLPHAERVTVVIYNSVGQVVMNVANATTQTISESIDMSQLEAGVYNIAIIGETNKLVEQVILTK